MLPNPKEFKNFKAELSERVKFDDAPGYNLESLIKTFKSNKIPSGKISNLINIEILKSNPNIQKILKHFVGYDKINESLVIILDDKVAAIQRATNKENQLIKWKTFGSKSYIRYKIKDEYVFCVYGMAEILLCEIFNLSYIGFQSDSIAKSLDNNQQFLDEIKPQLKDKSLILLLDNDDSCRSTIEPLEIEINEAKRIIPIEMQNLYDFWIIGGNGKSKDLPKGYDFKDLCNEIKDVKELEFILNSLIEVAI